MMLERRAHELHLQQLCEVDDSAEERERTDEMRRAACRGSPASSHRSTRLLHAAERSKHTMEGSTAASTSAGPSTTRLPSSIVLSAQILVRPLSPLT